MKANIPKFEWVIERLRDLMCKCEIGGEWNKEIKSAIRILKQSTKRIDGVRRQGK